MNAAFDNSGGKLVLSTEKPLFKELKETYKESVSSQTKDPTKGLADGQVALG